MAIPNLGYSLGAVAAERRHREYEKARICYDNWMAREYPRPVSGLQPRISSGHWSIVLGIPPTSSKAEINNAYRAKAKHTHSDTGGSDDAMTRLNTARDQAIRERTGK